MHTGLHDFIIICLFLAGEAAGRWWMIEVCCMGNLELYDF